MTHSTGVMPNSDPCQIITPLVLVGVRLGVGLGLGNQIAISTRGVILAGGRKWPQQAERSVIICSSCGLYQ